jgi:hypothetical protein
MTTNIHPMPNGGFEDEGPLFFNEHRRTSVIDHSDATRFLESKRSPNPASLIAGAGKTNLLKSAEGKKTKSKSKVKKGTEAKNLAKEAKGKGKKGSFGEKYSPVKAPGKGVRVAESARCL